MIKINLARLTMLGGALFSAIGMTSTGEAANCHATDGFNIVDIQFTAGIVTAGCSLVTATGTNISGTGRADPAGSNSVCGNLITGAKVEVTGRDGSGNAIAGCIANDTTANGAFTCDNTGCDTATKFRTRVTNIP